MGVSEHPVKRSPRDADAAADADAGDLSGSYGLVCGAARHLQNLGGLFDREHALSGLTLHMRECSSEGCRVVASAAMLPLMDKPPKKMTPNQIVAWNLQSARTWLGNRRHLSQAETVKLLEPFGVKLSRAAYSAAESSWRGKRVRHFSADEIYAFAQVFDKPFSYFFEPPPGIDEIAPEGASETTDWLTVLDRCYTPDFDLYIRLGGATETLELTAKWASEYRFLRARREREIEEAYRRVKSLRESETQEARESELQAIERAEGAERTGSERKVQ